MPWQPQPLRSWTPYDWQMASTVHELANGVPHDAAKHLSGHDREQRLVPMSKGCRRVERAHETRGTQRSVTKRARFGP